MSISMKDKYFAYINWLASNEEKRVVIVDYDDLNRLENGRYARFSVNKLGEIYKSNAKCFRYGAVAVETSGHHQLVLSQYPITLDGLRESVFFRSIYDKFFPLLESHSALSALGMKCKKDIAWRRHHSTGNFKEIIYFDD